MKSKVKFYQADITNIPDYTDNVKSRLLKGGDTSSWDVQESTNNDNEEDCQTCQNSGFMVCSECSGSGIVKRGEMSIYCPICVGYKKTRCPSCGGACVKCSP